MQPKSSVVLVHGEWTDGSSWSKVIPLLSIPLMQDQRDCCLILDNF